MNEPTATFPSHVFRAYDIRGLAGSDLDQPFARALGRACGAYFRAAGRPRAVLGHDCRESSPDLTQAAMAGLLEAGVDVILLGMVPTPILYFAAAHLATDAGVMITASHNPRQFNGFKIFCRGTTLHTDQIQEIARLMADLPEPPAGVRAVACEHDITPAYLDDMASRAVLHRPLKIVVDGGNGAAGPSCAALLRRLGADVVELFCEPDGAFPNHHPDPVVEENMGALKARVIAEGADLGVGLDGDGDRLGAFDEQGRMVYGDRVLALFARNMLRDHPGALVVGEVKCSHLMYRDIEAHGGKALMCAAGHSMLKAKMRETGALLGGEVSGHFFFADRYHGFDDAAYAAARLAEIMSLDPATPLSAMFESWPPTQATPEIRVHCPEQAKFAVAERARRTFAEQYETIDVDGVRIIFPDGWALVRASNTQPAVTMRFEAESEARLAEIMAQVKGPVERWIAEAAKC